MEDKLKSSIYIYCHFFLNKEKGVIKTVKVPLDNLNLVVLTLKQKIKKLLEVGKDSDTSNFCISSLSKTLESPTLLDTTKINLFFENKDDIFCKVIMNIQPIKKSELKQDDVLNFKTLSSYSFWVANKSIVKVRVPLPGVQNLTKESITSSFTDSSFDVKVHNLNGANYRFSVPRLDAKIVPEKSEAFADKEGNIIIRLRKAKEDDHWSYLFKQKYVGEN